MGSHPPPTLPPGSQRFEINSSSGTDKQPKTDKLIKNSRRDINKTKCRGDSLKTNDLSQWMQQVDLERRMQSCLWQKEVQNREKEKHGNIFFSEKKIKLGFQIQASRLHSPKEFYKSILCEASINCKCRCLSDNLSSQILYGMVRVKMLGNKGDSLKTDICNVFLNTVSKDLPVSLRYSIF